MRNICGMKRGALMKKMIILLIMVLVLMACNSKVSNDESEKQNNDDLIEIVNYRSMFNGEPLEEPEDEYQAFGIMISNSREARPQSALGTADVVYEIAVETYKITRFLAIFAKNHPKKIGPVRSARIPFVRMIQEWELPFAHFGSASTGKGDALSLINAVKPPIRFDGHKGINNKYYSRSSDRKAPHNAYFNSEQALEKIPSLKYEAHFNFDDESNIKKEPINSLSLYYSSYTPVKYEYNSTTKKYDRFIHDQLMMDAYTNEQIAVTNIIVQHAPHEMVERANYVLVNFVGEGKAEFYINGYYEVGTWKKDDFNSVTQFLNSAGEPIVLLPGNTWIQVVHPKVIIDRE